MLQVMIGSGTDKYSLVEISGSKRKKQLSLVHMDAILRAMLCASAIVHAMPCEPLLQLGNSM